MNDRGCVFCGATNSLTIYTIDEIDINKCDTCGLVFSAHYSSKEELLKLYDEDYFSGISDEGLDYMQSQAVMDYDKARFKQELKIIKKLKSDKGLLLDIGCATGHFLKFAREAGWQTNGVELSEPASKFARDTFNLNIFTGELADASFAEKSFDLITMHHVLEHVQKPVEFLSQQVIPLLRDDGLVVIEVPNFASFQRWVNGKDWKDFRPRQHYCHYTPNTLEYLLQICGLKPIRIGTISDASSSILGPLAYLGIPDKFISLSAQRAQSGPEESCVWIEPESNLLRRALRKLSYAITRPPSYILSFLKKEQRLVVYAKKKNEDSPV